MIRTLSLLVLWSIITILPVYGVTGTATSTSVAQQAAGTTAKPDFRYPKTVAANAEKQLQTALRNKDGRQTVDALVRYALAKGSISRENFPDIIRMIEKTIDKEKQADVRALLYHLEARLYSNYAATSGVDLNERQNPAETLPEDVSEWSGKQFNDKINELTELSFAPADELGRYGLDRYTDLIISDETGRKFCPVLLDFLFLHGIDMLAEENRGRYLGQWADIHAQDSVPLMFVLSQMIEYSESHPGDSVIHKILALSTGPRPDTETLREKLYNRFQNFEESGYILNHFPETDQYLDTFKKYAEHFPKSIFANAIRNKIGSIEAQNVQISYPRTIGSADSCEITLSTRNVNRIRISVYKVPETYYQTGKNYASFSIGQLRNISSREIFVDGEMPFDKRDIKVRLQPLPYGRYLITATATDSKAGSTRQKYSLYDLMAVSDLQLFSVSNQDSTIKVFAVDAQTGKPAENVTVTIRKQNTSTIVGTQKTDHEGRILLPAPSAGQNLSHDYMFLTLGASFQEDRHGLPFDISRSSWNQNRPAQQISVFTDLNIYRPGEIIRYTALVYELGTQTKQLQTGKEVVARFLDTNNKEIAADTLVTDSYGQIAGSFSIPTDRMNGLFSIRFQTEGKTVHHHSVHVSEYKTPTFLVDLSSVPPVFTSEAPVTVSGTVRTYSGLPLAGQAVQLTLQRHTWYYRMYGGQSGTLLNDTTVTTDADGNFQFTYPQKLFGYNSTDPHPRPLPFSTFTLAASSTDAAGETQEAQARFSFGRKRGLQLPGSLTFINDRAITLPLTFQSSDLTEKQAACSYQLRPANDTLQLVDSGNFRSDLPTVDFSRLPSGEYLLQVEITGDTLAEKAETHLILYKESDRRSPVNSAMWIPECGRRVSAHGKATMTLGTSTPESHIYFTASGRNRVLQEGWLHYTPGLHTLQFQVPDETEEILTVRLHCIHAGQILEESVRFPSPHNADSLTIRILSFRDRLVPGTQEQWSFRLIGKQGKARCGSMLLEMYNQALDELSANGWQFHPEYQQTNPSRFRSQYAGQTYGYYNYRTPWKQTDGIQLPELNLYNRGFFSYYTGGRRNMYATRLYKSAAMAVTEDCLEACDEEEEGASPLMQDLATADNGEMMVAEAKLYGAGNGMTTGAIETEEAPMPAPDAQALQSRLKDIRLRTEEVKVALWQPRLHSDSTGTIILTFDVPDYSTTWIMQAVAFTESLAATRLTRQIVTQKPLMVQPTLPRFLRSGDRATLTASIRNATDSLLTADILIELFNPRNDQLMAIRTLQKEIAAQGTVTADIQWSIPDTLPYIGFRIKAGNRYFGDGEQQMIPILPNVSPVTETTPFYLAAGDTSAAVILPKFPKEARITLEYCNNPVWYCVTALPTILCDHHTTTSAIIRNLFALTLAEGTARIHPEIREAIGYWKANNDRDSTLTSALSRLGDLKIGTLLASPWIGDAERQTLRMSKLDELLDSTANARQREILITRLKELQNNDGGFVWFRHPGSTSSLYTTQEVLQYIGELQQSGNPLKDNTLQEMTSRALQYYDRETVKRYEEMKKHLSKNTIHGKSSEVDFSSFRTFAYIRSLFPEHPLQGTAKTIGKKTVDHLKRHWGELSLTDKAYAALTLHRNGETREAGNITESLRQYSTTATDGSIYWDQLSQGAYRKSGNIQATALLLRAFRETGARSEITDRIRQWLLLEKQTTDWGNSAAAAEAVHAILSSGTQWLGMETAAITLNGESVDFTQTEKYLGYVRKTISLPQKDGNVLRISRPNNAPAWGSVYCQYAAPMKNVKPAGTGHLSVEKELYVYKKNGELARAKSLHKGDKVQVRCIIKNARDLEYVTLHDERGACLEPTDQRSGYKAQDGIFYYMETKDEATRIFFNRLPKGTHLISYDLHVTAPGTYQAGIATVQCQYAPSETAHSAGFTVDVKP